MMGLHMSTPTPNMPELQAEVLGDGLTGLSDLLQPLNSGLASCGNTPCCLVVEPQAEVPAVAEVGNLRARRLGAQGRMSPSRRPNMSSQRMARTIHARRLAKACEIRSVRESLRPCFFAQNAAQVQAQTLGPQKCCGRNLRMRSP